MLWLVLGSAAFFFYNSLQPVVDYSQAPLFDGNQYQKIYDHFRSDTQPGKIAFPYHSRLLVPYLASKMPFQNWIANFQALNFIFMLLSIAALHGLWKRLNIPTYMMFIGFGWLLFHWTGMIRLNQFDPANVDVPLYFFQTVLLLLVFSKKYRWLTLLGPLATLQKESFIALLVFLLIYHLVFDRNRWPLLWTGVALVLSIITKFGANQYFGAIQDISSFENLYRYALEAGAEPFKLVRWPAALFTAFGPWLVLLFLKYAKIDLSRTENRMLILFSLVYGSFGLVAGGDTTRILFLGFPFIATLCFYTLKNEHWSVLLVALALSLPLMRLASLLPDPVLQGSLFKSWYPELANEMVVLLWLVYALLCAGLLFWFTRFRKRLENQNL